MNEERESEEKEREKRALVKREFRQSSIKTKEKNVGKGRRRKTQGRRHSTIPAWRGGRRGREEGSLMLLGTKRTASTQGQGR